MKYIGHMEGSFKDKATGNEIKYAKLYVTYEQKGVVGLKAEEIKCSVSLIPDLAKLKSGADVTVYYDRYQRAEKIVVGGGN